MAGHRILHFSILRRVKLPSLIQLLNSDKTQLKRFITIGFSHTSKSSHFTPDEKLSRIPVEKLKITYSRSSGPGGQHVNKTSTKAEVRFHVQTAEWIPDEIRQEILLKNKSRINKAGELIVTSEISRSQHRNLEDCLQKICDMIAEACHHPPEPTKEDVELRSQRLEKRNLERLKQKKTHSATKQARRVDFD